VEKTMEDASQTAFLVMYAGRRIDDSQTVALSADPAIVGRFADMLPPGAIETPQQRRRPGLHLVEPPDDAA
jgi:hypothetical protein